MNDPQYLRELLRANLFDGYEGGTVTMPVAQLLTDIVDILEAAQPAPLDLNVDRLPAPAGYRRVQHDDGTWCLHALAQPAPLDERRLARAVHRMHNPDSQSECRSDGQCRLEAAAIARAYREDSDD